MEPLITARTPLVDFINSLLRERSSVVKHLRQLEDQSVYILREAYKNFDNLGMLWSMGKDSTVLLWLARKAFFGECLFHCCTSIPATRSPP